MKAYVNLNRLSAVSKKSVFATVARRLLFILLLAASFYYTSSAREIRDKHYKYRLTVPDAMIRMADSVNGGELFYDTTTKIVLIISERESKFHTVQDYIDCTKKELENQLKTFYTDSTLQLVNCSRSPYYSEISTVILFHEHVLPYGFNTCLVYFIHHRQHDLQFTFTYNDGATDPSKYIDAVMRTLKLK